MIPVEDVQAFLGGSEKVLGQIQRKQVNLKTDINTFIESCKTRTSQEERFQDIFNLVNSAMCQRFRGASEQAFPKKIAFDKEFRGFVKDLNKIAEKPKVHKIAERLDKFIKDEVLAFHSCKLGPQGSEESGAKAIADLMQERDLVLQTRSVEQKLKEQAEISAFQINRQKYGEAAARKMNTFAAKGAGAELLDAEISSKADKIAKLQLNVSKLSKKETQQAALTDLQEWIQSDKARCGDDYGTRRAFAVLAREKRNFQNSLEQIRKDIALSEVPSLEEREAKALQASLELLELEEAQEKSKAGAQTSKKAASKKKSKQKDSKKETLKEEVLAKEPDSFAAAASREPSFVEKYLANLLKVPFLKAQERVARWQNLKDLEEIRSFGQEYAHQDLDGLAYQYVKHQFLGLLKLLNHRGTRETYFFSSDNEGEDFVQKTWACLAHLHTEKMDKYGVIFIAFDQKEQAYHLMFQSFANENYCVKYAELIETGRRLQASRGQENMQMSQDDGFQVVGNLPKIMIEGSHPNKELCLQYSQDLVKRALRIFPLRSTAGLRP